MKINRDMLNEMAKLNDRELWEKIREIAKENNLPLSEKPPKESDLAKVRRMLDGSEKISFSEGMRLINTYKKGDK